MRCRCKWARERGIEVMGEVEFAFRLCPCPIVAVTGSNGKTTTSTVIAEIIKSAGRQVCLCGNIGSPFSKHVLDLKPTDIGGFGDKFFSAGKHHSFQAACGRMDEFQPEPFGPA